MIDANNTGFRLVFGPQDWTQRVTAAQPPAPGSVIWDDAAGVVRLRGRAVARPGDAANVFTLEDRRPAARDRYGSWYTVDIAPTPEESDRIRVRPTTASETVDYWPTEDPVDAEHSAGDSAHDSVRESGDEKDAEPGAFVAAGETDVPAPKRFSGLTITTRDYLVVGTLDPAGLLVFDLHGGGPPERLAWPDRIPFHPVDLAPRPGGGVWILDRAPGEASGDAYAPRLWTLDRAFRVVSTAAPADEPGPAFRPKSDMASADAASTDTPGCFDTRLSLDLAYPLDAALGVPISLESLPDDTVLVAWRDAALDPAVSRIQRLQPLSARDPERGLVDLSAALSTYLDSGTWQVHDIAVDITRNEPRPVLGILYAVGRGGEQALSFDLRARSDDLQLIVREQYLPLRRFGGGGLASTLDGVFYDSRDRWLPVAAQPRTRFFSEGTVETRVPFDGDGPRTTWHRVFLDACIPPDCHVQVESRSANSREQLRSESWQSEPAPYLRDAGSELPFDRPFGSDTPAGTGTWEVLLQQAEGRYLDLRLTLCGNGRATPRIQSLRVYAPRFSYLKEYLPDIYQNDDTSADFLERFLANPEGLFTALEGRIAAAEQLFDTRTVPSEYLDWLGGWLGAEFSSDLEAERRRLFLDHALPLYRRRGTMSGLLTLIDLALHPCPDASLFDRLTGVPNASDNTQRSDASSATGVRIVEAFRTRTQSRIRLGDVREERQPRLLPANASWDPADGLAALNRLFVRFLEERYDTPAARRAVWPGSPVFPPLLPDDPAQREDWRDFTGRELGSPYAAIERDDADALRAFRTFLARSHTASSLQAAYGEDTASNVPLPPTFPGGTRAYTDWVEFVSFVRPLQLQAHRFSVLVPSRPGDTPNAQQQRIEQVRRIVFRERPAHTLGEVQPFWALFRVGYVRVPYDTVLGESSRYAALVLGTTSLSEGTLDAAHPFGVRSRRVVGRDAASSSTPL